MTENRLIIPICVVVHNLQEANANWAKVLGLPEEKVETIFPNGILHYTTHNQAMDYKCIQVDKYELENFVLELLQPGEAPSPWKAPLDIELSRNNNGDFSELFLNTIHSNTGNCHGPIKYSFH